MELHLWGAMDSAVLMERKRILIYKRVAKAMRYFNFSEDISYEALDTKEAT